ncbi:MAG: hypothetical protein KAT16_01520 [Candidatus Heimdallarchaeota archaeon]|nr:hypothetical protein [Candidatus Heimdallarchaeota archaeon]
MENIQKLQKYGSLESFALDQTEEFLRPKSLIDSLFTLSLLFWCITSVIFTNNLVFRASLFFFVIALFFFIPISSLFTEKNRDIPSPLNRSVKILIAFILINIFSSASAASNLWEPSFIPITYIELESILACLFVPIAIIWNRFSFETLQFGYFYYLSEVFRGFWIASLTIIILRGISLLIIPESLHLDVELALLGALVLNIIGLVISNTPSSKDISISTLLRQSISIKTRVERVRDGFLSSSSILLVLLWIPNWLFGDLLEIIEYTAFFLLILGIMLLLSPQKKKGDGVKSILNSLTGNIIDPSSSIGTRVQDFAKTIQETDFKKPERVFTIPTDDMAIVSKGKTFVKAKKGSIAVPTVTDTGTTLVLMGKSEVTTEGEEQEISTKEIEGTTTIWVPPEEWKEIKLKLTPKNIDELTDIELMNAGLESTTELFNQAKDALSRLKNWKGPQGMFSSVFDTAPSKYTIKETKDYTHVRLPGIFVFERAGIQLVQVLGSLVQVVDIKGVGEYVKILGGLVTVLETPEYSFVKTPFVSVLETPKGEIVKVFGIRFQEGENIDLEHARQEIMTAQEKFDRLFTDQVDSLFQEEIPSILLTGSNGGQEGFLIGSKESLSDQEFRRKKKTTKSKKKKVKSKGLISQKEINLPRKNGKNQVSDDPSVSYKYDEHGIPIDHSDILSVDEELNEIEEALDRIDNKFLNNEISEEKHEKMTERFEQKQLRLKKKKEELLKRLKLEFID